FLFFGCLFRLNCTSGIFLIFILANWGMANLNP
ncbi:unnamed protein product, partial [marine sediment metagenome]